MKIDILLNRLKKHINSTPDKIIFRYIENDLDTPKSITFKELDYEIKKVASLLQERYSKGDRALLLYPSGLDFIYAFLGCLYAGVVAVPAYPPRKNQKIDRLRNIIEDCDAKVVLTTDQIYRISKDIFEKDELFSNISLISTETINNNRPFTEVLVDNEDLAFLQYTSGSTGNPKGVMVSYKNISSNLKVLEEFIECDENTIGTSWLPHFHDMGLIGGVLLPVYVGFEAVLMTPLYFLQKPIRWLQVISDYRVNITTGPNFAYELCINNIKDEELKDIDLSSLHSMLNGAEPIYADTLNRFTKKFKKCGFDKKVHCPCYGMAETTLIVTGIPREKEYRVISVDSKALKNNQVVLKDRDKETQKLVSCGVTRLGHEVVIVDNNMQLLDENMVGEICVKGTSVTKGYWRNSSKTKDDFYNYLKESEEPYFKTGDLGFLYDNELYICGRKKALMIIRGKNYYPHDIELSTYNSHEALVNMGTAVFSIEKNGLERVVVVQEVKRTYIRKLNQKEVFKAIQEAISINHEIEVYDIVLVKPGQLKKTSSGKIQRHNNKEAYLENQFSTLHRFLDIKSSTDESRYLDKIDIDLIKNSMEKDRHSYIANWLQNKIASLMEIDKEQISLEKSIIGFGIDSLMLIKLQSEVMEELSITVPLEYFYDYPSIVDLSKKLLEILLEDENNHQKDTPLKLIEKDSLTSYDSFNLSNIQQAYLLGRDSSITLGNTACFAYGEFETEGLDILLLEKAWNRLIERHEMLRCLFDVETMRQKIEKRIAYQKLNIVDISNRGQILSTTLNPAQSPLAQINIYPLSTNRVRVGIYVDMLVCDASSIGILLSDLRHFYEKPNVALAPIKIGFKEYLAYQDSYKKSDDYQKSYDYWMSRLETLPSAPKLPLIVKEEEIKHPKFTRRSHTIDSQKWIAFKEKSATLNVTPTVMLLSIYAKVLSLWSNESHFCINLTLFDRHNIHPDINSVIGDFTRLSPLEVNSPADKRFDVLMYEIQKQLFLDLDNRGMDGIEISRQLRSKGREGNMPVVFTSIIGLEELDTSWLGELVDSISQTPQVWIDNQVSQSNGKLVINWDCLDELFPKGMLDELFNLYISFIEKVIDDKEVIDKNRFDYLYRKYNETTMELNTQIIPQQCMDMALNQGEKEAVVCGNERITYQQIHNASAQLAQKIEKLGIKPNEHVAILLPKGWEQIVSILACGYAGVAYLPLSISYPQKRIEYLLKEASVQVLLGSRETFELFDCDIETVDVKRFVDIDKDMGRYEVKAKEDDLAYTIFTSGSTGQPKGVMISHKSVCNTVMDINQRFEVTHRDVIFNISELNFDLSVYDIYGGLSSGATIVIPKEEDKLSPNGWLDLLHSEKITIWNSVPTFMELLSVEAKKQQRMFSDSLRLVLMSGDFIPIELIKKIEKYSQKCEIISLGGATEASIWSIYYPLSKLDKDAKKIPYGFPLANQKIYILDENLQAKPAFVHGEICIKGKGVADGYYRDKEKTDAQFVKDSKTGETIYKTGDIGYFNPKGYIEILGRVDDQVKIRGFRIELGEIEQQLLKIDEVKESVVLAKEDKNKNKSLVAYITTLDNQELKSDRLKSLLSEPLPEYMIPSFYKTIDSIPLTPNGKIDKKALAKLDIEIDSSTKYVAPRDETQKILVRIFQEVLNVEKVGIYDDFFELGGHSLLATQLVSKIEMVMNVKLPIIEIFNLKNIEELSAFLKLLDSSSNNEEIVLEGTI